MPQRYHESLHKSLVEPLARRLVKNEWLGSSHVRDEVSMPGFQLGLWEAPSTVKLPVILIFLFHPNLNLYTPSFLPPDPILPLPYGFNNPK